MNSFLKGLLSEKRFVTIALELGWEVALPVDTSAAYDLLINRDKSWKKVQIKTIRSRLNRTKYVDIRRGRRNEYKYVNSDFDLLAVVDWPHTCYVIPFFEFNNLTSFSLSGKFQKYKIWAGQS